MTATVLFVPGLRDHVEDHWQTHAARAVPGSVTVEPLTEDRLSLAARVAALDAALNAIEGEVVIAAHSAGWTSTTRVFDPLPQTWSLPSTTVPSGNALGGVMCWRRMPRISDSRQPVK